MGNLKLNMSKNLTLAFLIILISIFNNALCSKNLMKQHLPTASPMISLTVDNTLMSISALKDGGFDEVPLTGIKNTNDWTHASKISLEAYPHMTGIQITGKNVGAYSKNNPAGILASVSYKCNGKLETINTGSDWECKFGKNDWTPAKVIAANKGPSIWTMVFKKPIAQIPLNASWIRNPNVKASPVTCRMIFPCEKHEDEFPDEPMLGNNGPLPVPQNTTNPPQNTTNPPQNTTNPPQIQKKTTSNSSPSSSSSST